MEEKAQYITCPRGHKIYVVWSPLLKRFAFTCDECENHSVRAVSVHGVVEVQIVKPAHGVKA